MGNYNKQCKINPRSSSNFVELGLPQESPNATRALISILNSPKMGNMI